jgi:hypothetical protein
MQSTLTQLAIPKDFIERFDELAYATGRRREDVMLAALMCRQAMTIQSIHLPADRQAPD